ncbi:MAG: hypothetical protein JWQ10_373 [Herbaspirillum sp.]|nr:hypothetical protein [Herbaspirillum sp.]
MKSVDTGYTPPSVNPLIYGDYKLYAASFPLEGGGFSAVVYAEKFQNAPACPRPAYNWKRLEKVFQDREVAEVFALQWCQFEVSEGRTLC